MRTIEEQWAVSEAEEERQSCIQAQRVADRTFEIGWICGVPEKELQEVYHENTRFI